MFGLLMSHRMTSKMITPRSRRMTRSSDELDLPCQKEEASMSDFKPAVLHLTLTSYCQLCGHAFEHEVAQVPRVFYQEVERHMTERHKKLTEIKELVGI